MILAKLSLSSSIEVCGKKQKKTPNQKTYQNPLPKNFAFGFGHLLGFLDDKYYDA